MPITPADIHQLFAYTDQPPHIKLNRWQQSALASSGQTLVAVVSTPKSGSTWAANVLSHGSGLAFRRFCYAYSSNEHDLYEPALLKARLSGGVSQLHMRATPHNVALLKQFDVKTVLLSRNAYDSVVSFAKDLGLKLKASPANPGQLGYSFVWLSEDMKEWPFGRLLDYAIDFYLPWYINFLRSWDSYKNSVDVQVIRYEDLRQTPVPVFRKALAKFALPETVAIETLVNKKFGNAKLMSQSNSSDGELQQALSPQQQQRITTLFERETSEWVISHLQ